MGMVFYEFRIMYVTGIVMFAVSIISLYLRRIGRLFDTRWFLRVLVVMTHQESWQRLEDGILLKPAGSLG